MNTRPPATLQVELGHASLRGAHAHNEDFCGAVTPDGAELDVKGVLAAIGDGVGGHADGREASEFAVRGLLADYYATPDTWGIAQSLETVINALNRWLASQTARSREAAGMATTLSALVLRGRRYTIAHVGDSRIYRLRGGRLDRLTSDHVWAHPELDNVLSRAIGLDERVAIDIADGDAEVGDVFALLTDGVWETLGDARISETLAQKATPEAVAQLLARGAEHAGSRDDCTALVLRVTALPADDLRDAISRMSARPLPPLLKPGETLDGLTVETLVHDSRMTRLYRVRDAAGRQYVLKTLRPEASDAACTAALAHEEWLASRVRDAHFPQVVPQPAATRLYYLMSWHEGATLAARLATGQPFATTEVAELGIELVKGLATLHRLAIVHRDIKPANLHVGADGRLRILDLGVAASDGQAEARVFGEINNPGTPSYMAPELFAGESASVRSDLFAAGVTLYELLTRRFPYGEIEPFQRPRFGDPVPPTRWRADIPHWLESVILKAVARERRDRFETAEEFLLALELGAHRPLAVPRSSPLLRRDPELGIKIALVVSGVLNILLLYLLLAR
ncbi:bifunctional protein-serine/threonine kinase/phosphatase [Pseudazoarcus pumilus]|uniref:non-specific serine/threonine protein kinase n=1 Tax=Pseudazoarcus pumilus TaxID=2067960 RepID=A0A2I6S4B9_9RHOO|nr:bifunctional protein-serine/threonine kinase/phosphatase [Pseudazoarcus pumilus]AUN94104.1 serine/threonine protein phosphatase [Pseudazoarcus pumilus]